MKFFSRQSDVSYWFYVTTISSRGEYIVRTWIQYGYIESINKEIRSVEVVFKSIKGEKVGYFESCGSKSLLSCYIVRQFEAYYNLLKKNADLSFTNHLCSPCYIVDTVKQLVSKGCFSYNKGFFNSNETNSLFLCCNFVEQ